MESKRLTLIIFSILVSLVCCKLQAQLINWPDSPNKTFVFEISNKEAEDLLKSKPQDSLVLKMLHTPVTSFSEKWENQSQQGHFIFANILKNRVNYRYVPIMPFQVFLYKEYGVLTLQVVDSAGIIRDNAKVRIRKGWSLLDSHINFDKTSQTYTIDDWSEKEERIMTVELDKFRAVFKLNKHLINPWYGGYRGSGNSPEFYSYMITDKNKYKPNETVRFKSYALSGNKNPIKKELEIWMRTSDSYNSYKKIKTIEPYNPGGFAGEVQLHDSLKLKLDKHYNIQLRDKNGRIVSNTNFRYEDYELYDNKLEVKLKNQTQFYPDTNQIEIKVTDANGLLLQDVEADILIKRKNVLHTYTDVFVMPDTLLYKKIKLDNTTPTTVDIPASLLGESDCTYDIQVEVWTFDNQWMKDNKSVNFYRSHHNLVHTTHNDTIRFSFYELGKEQNIEAKLSHNNSKENKTIQLPYEEIFNQGIKSYSFIVGDSLYSTNIYTENVKSNLDIEGGIEKDSFNIKLINPLCLDVSWYLYQGNRLLEKGFGKELDFKYANTDLDLMHYVEIFYFMGEEEKVFRRTFVPKTDFLSVDIDLPERIYPGQKLDATITVKDNWGKPVSDVDLTAFSVNSLLNYHVPDLPYYGSTPQSREQRSSYSINDLNFSFSMPLNYNYWNDIANLDKMDYYRFTYPWDLMFTHTVNTPDSTTQFAPYVMKDGNAVNIYVIEFDNVPVYFSWTEQPKAYSFLASGVIPHKITLRLHDRSIVLDSMQFERSKKTIFSIDLDHLPSYAKVIKLENRDNYRRYKFTGEESSRYRHYISELPVPDSLSYTYLLRGKEVFPVFHSCFMPRKKEILAGPLPEGKMQYVDGVKYKHEGGFSYKFEDNVVYKYPKATCPDYLTFSSNNNFQSLNQFTLTSAEFEKKIEECKIETNQWHPGNIYISQPDMTLNFRLPNEEDKTGVSNLLFKNTNSGKILFPDKVENGIRKYSSLPTDTYDVILLYNNGKYITYSGISLSKNAYTEINMKNLTVHPSDSISKKWLSLRTFDAVIGAYKPTFSTTQYISTRKSGNTVYGYLFDNQGEPLIGVSIVIKGTSFGTISDIDGHFEIDIDGGYATLEFRYIGFNPKEMNVTSGSEISVILEEDMLMLEEVVVVGYGVMKKSNLTGAVMGLSVSSDRPSPQSPPEEVVDSDIKAEAETEEAESKLYNELLQLNGLRSNFSDVGFWQPTLYTDKKGKAEFTVTFPDNITKWETVVYAMNRKLKTGTARKFIKSYKPLMAELKTPQFLVAGDSSYFAGNIRNYTKDKLIEGRIMFELEQDTLMNKEIELSTSYQDKILVNANEADSISAAYLFTRNDGYSDGEKRIIPIQQQGTELAEGTLGFLRNGDKMSFTSDKNEEVHLTITGKQLDIYMDATYYLTGYKYACNEQLASKLIGLLNYKVYMQYIGEKFKYDKKVNEIVKRLLDNRNDKQLWSWWGHSSNTSFWMSAHILKALKMAKEAGYEVNFNLSRIEQDYADISPYRRANLYDIEIVHALSEWDAKQDYEKALDIFDELIRKYEHTEDSIARKDKKYMPVSYLKEKLLLQEIRQKQNIGYSSENISKYLKKDILGAVYCDDGKRNRYWYSDNLATTLIAYRIVKNDSLLHSQKEPMQMYVLGTKSYGWNTYQASSATATILPDLFAESFSKEIPATVILSGKENETLTKFPYETKLNFGEGINIEKKDGMPLIYSAYSIKRVTEANKSDAFEVSSFFESGDNLKAGEVVKLTATVTIKQKNAEHVMIEIPIPAGCSYASKRNYYGREVHREYFKEKTVIFCENLPEGTYSFTTELLPRYTGKYILNPAKVELMYFPVINANNRMRKIVIDKK